MLIVLCMKRHIYSSLLKWKYSDRRKPLLLRGARQTGKTYLLSEFGRKEYENFICINFEKDRTAADFFKESLDAKKLIQNLSIYTGRRIRPEKDIIFFDEIQACNGALSSLKYFYEQVPQYHVAAAGSLLGIAISGPGSFPVGKVNFWDLFPMNFLEYLDALGLNELKEVILNANDTSPYPEPFHKELIRQLKNYCFTGGMPEVVASFASNEDFAEARQIQSEILASYTFDFAKYSAGPDIPKLRMVWDSIPAQLSKENKKFLFKMLKKSARLRDFENAIQWLEKAGLVYRVFKISVAKRPLNAYVKENIFKLYCLDVGLLSALADIPPKIVVQGNEIFEEFKGALAENFVLQELKASKASNVYYWESEGQAEVDFIFEKAGRIFPLEVKAGVNVRSKSLHSFDQKFSPPYLGRTSLMNLKYDGRILNVPLYAVSTFPRNL